MAYRQVPMSSKRYPEKFKIEAVKQAVDRGHSVPSVAVRLGTTTHRHYDWIKAYDRGSSTPPIEEAALMALDAFAEIWDDKYPQIYKSWRAHWENLNTLFIYPLSAGYP